MHLFILSCIWNSCQESVLISTSFMHWVIPRTVYGRALSCTDARLSPSGTIWTSSRRTSMYLSIVNICMIISSVWTQTLVPSHTRFVSLKATRAWQIQQSASQQMVSDCHKLNRLEADSSLLFKYPSATLICKQSSFYSMPLQLWRI